MKTAKDREIMDAMVKHGGEFTKRLADLALHADPIQFEKIKKTWPGYWEKYERIGRRKKL